MNHDFTIDEIKNSLEYRWRKSQIKSGGRLCLAVAVIAFFVMLFYEIVYNFKFLVTGIITCLCLIGVMGLVFLGCFLFDYGKMRYLLKNYQKFNSYEVVLDKPSNSFFYRRSLYYTVTVKGKGLLKNVDTNPCFSNAFFSEFTCEDFNNKKVVGLYDDVLDKFYIVKKV